MDMTLAEALAVAVLKGDFVAAYALVDRLTEERGAAAMPRREWSRDQHAPPPRIARTYDVISWPEFRALADRLGVAPSLFTTGLVLLFPVDGVVMVEQEYIAGDNGTAAGEAPPPV